MRTYQIYGTASQANAAQIRILGKGRIRQVFWSLQLDGTADNSSVNAELSFAAVASHTTNDPAGVISGVLGPYANVSAAGFGVANLTACDVGIDCPVNIGDLIYLNISTTSACLVKALIRVEE